MIKTVSILIGNSDDKLSQQEWHEFVNTAKLIVLAHSKSVYFEGGSNNESKFQNFCFVASLENDRVYSIKNLFRSLADKYKQDSIAWVEGETEFI